MWTKGPQPPEMLELILCRDVYHCTPRELAEQDLDTVLDHLLVLQVEDEVKRLKRQMQTRGRR